MSESGRMSLKGVSISYVAEEDRLLLEALFNDSSMPLWITRRGALRFIDALNNQLGKTSSQNMVTKRANDHPPIAFERDIAATKNPPHPGEMQLNINDVRSGDVRVGVLKTLQINCLRVPILRYQLNFIDTCGRSFQISLDRSLLLNLVTLLIQQTELAQW